MRQQEGHGTRRDGGDSVAPLVGGGHRPLLRRLGHLDAPRVDGDVLRRRRKANQHGKQRNPAKALRRIATGDEPEPEDDERLADQHPRTPVAEPSGEHRHFGSVDERRPQEFEAGDQGDEAEEADHFEGEP